MAVLTRGTYDYAATGAGANQSLLVPSATAGTWYVLVYAESVPQPGAFSLTARGADLEVTASYPGRASSSAPATLTVTGGGFDSGTTVELVASNGTVITPSSFGLDSYTQMTATFPTGLPVGTYAVRVTRGTAVETLSGALQVTSGTARLETNLILPNELGLHVAATLYVEYANTGDAAMPAPLLSLQSADADNSDRPVFTLDESRVVQNFWSAGMPPGTSNSALILGSGRQPGVLNPGERIRVPVYYLGLLHPLDGRDYSDLDRIHRRERLDVRVCRPCYRQRRVPPSGAGRISGDHSHRPRHSVRSPLRIASDSTKFTTRPVLQQRDTGRLVIGTSRGRRAGRNGNPRNAARCDSPLHGHQRRRSR